MLVDGPPKRPPVDAKGIYETRKINRLFWDIPAEESLFPPKEKGEALSEVEVEVPPPNKPVPVEGAGVEVVLVVGLGGRPKRPVPTLGVDVVPLVVDEIGRAHV